jgi:hypothetical protein
MTMDPEPTMLIRLGTLMRDTQKVISLWSSLSLSLLPLDRKPSKFDQSSFVLVQLQAKRRQPRVEFVRRRRGALNFVLGFWSQKVFAPAAKLRASKSAI